MEQCLKLPAAPTPLTADDVCRAGACSGGVGKRLRAIVDTSEVAAAEDASRMLTLVRKDERDYIFDAVAAQTLLSNCSTTDHGNGYGNGYGNGDGYGYGDGYGGLSGVAYG